MECGGALNPNLPLPAVPRPPAPSFPWDFLTPPFSGLFQMGAGGGSDVLPAPRSKAQAHGAG